MKKQEDFIATVCEAVAMVEPQTERAELWLTQHFRPEELHIGFLLIEQSRLSSQFLLPSFPYSSFGIARLDQGLVETELLRAQARAAARPWLPTIAARGFGHPRESRS